MATYMGVECPVCKQAFVDGDDIVVCPICGAPHHRACYHQQGNCALEHLHADNYAWENPNGKNPQINSASSSDGPSTCTACKTTNPPQCLFCQTCGANLVQQRANPQAPASRSSGYTPPVINAYTMAFGGLAPTAEIDGVTVRDLAIFVGPNAPYFLPQFQLISHQAGVSLNIPSMLFSFLYFFFRKMYSIGSLMLALMLLSQLPLFLIMPEFVVFFVEHFKDILLGIDVMSLFHPQNFLWVYQSYNILQFVPFVITVIFSCFANRIYFAFCLKQVRRIKQQCEQASGGFNDHDYGLLLAKRGRTGTSIIFLTIVLLVVAYFAVSFYYLLPYRDTLTAVFTQVMGK